MYEQLEPRNDRVQIQYGFDKITIESIHDSDTVDNLLDLCVRAIRGLGFNFKHPQDEIAEYERILVRIAEIVEGEDPDPTSPGDVVDAVYRTVQKLLDNRAENRQTIADLRKEVQNLKQNRDDLRLKVSSQQIGIDAQKAKIEELTSEVEKLKTCADAEGFTRWTTRNGSFMWALHQMREGNIVRRLVRERKDGSKIYSQLSPDIPSRVIRLEDYNTTGWEIVR